MSKAVIYEPLPAGARPVAWWWAILQVPLLMIGAAIGAALLAFLLGLAGFSVAILTGSWDPAQRAEPPEIVIGLAIAGAMLGLFISLALLSILKVKMEKRPLATAGLNGFLYGPRFWGGFLNGIGIALVLGIPAALAGLVFGMPEQAGDFYPANLLTAKFALAVLCIFGFVMIQAPAEEIFVRGWLLSALGWRHGLIPAMVFSSVVFSLLHADRVVAGWGWLVYVLLAVGGIGVLFAGIAYAARSVLPAAGMHTGYNFCLITLGVGYLIAQSEDGNVLTAVNDAFDLENLPPFELSPVMVIDMLGRFLIPVLIAAWLISRRDRKTV